MSNFYFTPYVTSGTNHDLIWWVEKELKGNNLESVHKSCGLYFESEEKCKEYIDNKIEKNGGSYRTEKKKHLDLFREEIARLI